MERSRLNKIIKAMEQEGGESAEYARTMKDEFDTTSDAPLSKKELKDIELLLKKLDHVLNKPLVKGKRLFRNDPCICKSGKKFKKCCGQFVKKN